ncbi:hypothetical protein JTE90_014161 [Oedothorax gibbosus]|uniref:Uncharacterized protein n=1 Tax=Oedothorax gibbosus TaxID=931172 RepID=A0AAV6VJC8_9ARAC|nr:hypothetical protein JTE90_014161 [Oedothorax gibbosus]
MAHSQEHPKRTTSRPPLSFFASREALPKSGPFCSTCTEFETAASVLKLQLRASTSRVDHLQYSSWAVHLRTS